MTVRSARATALLSGVAAVAGAVVMGFAASGERPLDSPLVGVLVLLSYIALALSLEPELLFVAWLGLSPFFQESSHASFIGEAVHFFVYRITPILLIGTVVVTHRRRHRATAVDFMPALYLFYVLVSANLLSSPSEPVRDELRSIYVTIIVGILIYYFVVFGPTTSKVGERIARALIASATIISVMTIVEAFTGWNLWHDVAWQHGTPPRAVATLANPAVLGTFLGMSIAFAVAILIWDGPQSLRKRSTLLLMLALPALFFTYTRGPMIAVAAVALCMVFFRSKTAWPGVALLILVVTVFIASWNHISSSSVYRSRLGVADTAETRLALQTVSIKLFEQKPLAGWGFGSFDTAKKDIHLTSRDSNVAAAAGAQANTSHDTFLTVLVELGILGLFVLYLPWMLIAWRAVKAARHSSPDRWIFIAALGALGVYAVSAGTFDMRFFSFVPMLAWLAVALMRRTFIEREMQSRSM